MKFWEIIKRIFPPKQKKKREEEKKGKKEEEKEEKKRIKMGEGRGFWIAIVIVCIALAGFDAYLFQYTLPKKILGEEWNWGWATFFTQILYTIFSFKIVGPTELGAILFFGRPIKPVRSGLVFVPLGICKLVKESRLTTQDELPAPPEKIFRGDGVPPPDMFPPIRIPFANVAKGNGKKKKDKEEKTETEKEVEEDPLYRRVTAEVVPIIRWRINDYILFLTTIGTRDEAKKQMEDATVAFCMRELTQIPVAEALVTLSKFNAELQKIIEEMVHNWGIRLETAQIKLINFHHDLNEAISSVPEAEYAAKKRRLGGRGEGDAERAVLTGRTQGYKYMKEELGLDATLIVAAETSRAITQNPGQKTVIAGVKGFAELIGAAKGISEALKEEGGKS